MLLIIDVDWQAMFKTFVTWQQVIWARLETPLTTAHHFRHILCPPLDVWSAVGNRPDVTSHPWRLAPFRLEIPDAALRYILSRPQSRHVHISVTSRPHQRSVVSGGKSPVIVERKDPPQAAESDGVIGRDGGYVWLHPLCSKRGTLLCQSQMKC